MAGNRVSIISLIMLLCTMYILPARAQGTGCAATELSDPPRVLYNCPNGLVVEAEALAEFDLAKPAGAGSATPAAISDGAVLIELESGAAPFQISTPYAIASVRGTVFVVEAQPSATSVFVVEGLVAVSRPDGDGSVVLGMGDGVDVSPGEPLVVLQWPAERVSVLLARFSR